jgi:hypothetical protein
MNPEIVVNPQELSAAIGARSAAIGVSNDLIRQPR